jgi:hypothetical protein
MAGHEKNGYKKDKYRKTFHDVGFVVTKISSNPGEFPESLTQEAFKGYRIRGKSATGPSYKVQGINYKPFFTFAAN